MRSYLILSMCALFLVYYFYSPIWLQILVILLSLLAFLGSSFKADPFPKWLGIVMMTAGILIEWNKGTGLAGIGEGLMLILPLLCLITLAPLLSIPLRIGGSFEAIAVLLRQLLTKPKKLYAGVTSTLFLLSPVLSLGSVRIVNDLLEELKLPAAFSAKSYLVGYMTAVMWSPYFASVSLVLHYMDVPFKNYIMYGIGFSLLSLLIGNVLFSVWAKRNPFTDHQLQAAILEKSHRIQLAKLVLFMIVLMGICLAVETVFHWSMIVIVCMVSIIVPFAFGLLTKQFKRMLPLLKDYRDRTVPMMNNEIMLFMSAGMLAFAMKGTGVANQISMWLTEIAAQSFLLFALAVMAIILSVTFIGVHQIAAVGALAMQLNAAELGMSNLGLALLLLLTWAISTALSPFSGLNLMVSRFSGISGVQVGLRANGLHLSILALVGIALISLIG